MIPKDRQMPMIPIFLSSGEPLADRRYHYATELDARGETVAAADLVEQALDLAAGWAAGWFRLGELREKLGAKVAAADAFAKAAALDPDDRLGAALKRARLDEETPVAPPAGYVRALFEAYADTFETALVDALDYRAPDHLLAAIEVAGPGRRFARALDLGCGTGLMGARLRARVERLEGVDLSERMIGEAAAKGIYDALAVGDIVADLLSRPAGSLDLVCAADVFCYLGDLAPVIAAAHRALAPSGMIAFTVERLGLQDDPRGYRLLDSLRYAHGTGYLADRLTVSGFAVEVTQGILLRSDRGHPIEGVAAVARRR
jgi:predicted TPR repeat methyltransferase